MLIESLAVLAMMAGADQPVAASLALQGQDRAPARRGDRDWQDRGDRWNRGGIVVYRDDGFRGASQTFTDAISDLGRSGMNDAISSMQMRGQWTACTDANFRGQCQTFSGDVSSLRAAGMNDRISSLRPGRHDGGGDGGWDGGWDGGRSSVTIYRDADYRGATFRFDNEMPNLGNTGFNDAISSMRFRGEWEACTDAYYRGQCVTFRDDIRDLRNSGLNDRISSLRPVRRGGRR